MRTVRIILRAIAAVLAAAFALLTLALSPAAVLGLRNEEGPRGFHPDGWFLGLAAYSFFILAFCVFTALVSLAFFRYARFGALRRSKAAENTVMIDRRRPEELPQ
jgi:hypothetical protein